ncbi:MAG: hypothetical protein P0116_15465 [Candidatus Nitrosocosmicus sp.]|nr:hypothetical protein [Candidatus Nitrosocosmicus sp.]
MKSYTKFLGIIFAFGMTSLVVGFVSLSSISAQSSFDIPNISCLGPYSCNTDNSTTNVSKSTENCESLIAAKHNSTISDPFVTCDFSSNQLGGSP